MYVVPLPQPEAAGTYQVDRARNPLPSCFSTASGVDIGRAVSGMSIRQLVPAESVMAHMRGASPTRNVILPFVPNEVSVVTLPSPSAVSRMNTMFDGSK